MEFADKSVTTSEQQRVTVTIRVTSGPVPWSYAATARTWVPMAARVAFGRDRINGGDWSDWSAGSAVVSGRNVRADGQQGAERSETTYGAGSAAMAEIYNHLRKLAPTDDLPAAFALLDCGCPEDAVEATGHQEGCSAATVGG